SWRQWWPFPEPDVVIACQEIGEYDDVTVRAVERYIEDIWHNVQVVYSVGDLSDYVLSLESQHYGCHHIVDGEWEYYGWPSWTKITFSPICFRIPFSGKLPESYLRRWFDTGMDCFTIPPTAIGSVDVSSSVHQSRVWAGVRKERVIK